MKKQLFLFSFMIAMISNAIAFDEHSFYDETEEKSQWQFIEKQFITDIDASQKSTWTHTLIPAIALLGCGTTYMSLTVEEGQKLDTLQAKTVYAGVSAGLLTLSAVSAFDCYLHNQANRAAVLNFFNNWEQNQFYTPIELEVAFSMITEMIELEGQDAILVHANEIVETIQFLTTRHFEGRYKNTLDVKASSALSEAKTTTEVIKLFTDAAKNLKS